MPDRRRIVPDNSALFPAFFNEPQTKTARRLENAIRCHDVVAYAPDLLLHEFIKCAHKRARGRSDSGTSEIDEVERRVLDFLTLPIIYVPGMVLSGTAWDLIRNRGISPPDSWYVACAMYHQAEFWVSHEHRDDLVSHARRVHSGKVFLLKNWK